jgi:transglutaminase-like putative cysteine protease
MLRALSIPARLNIGYSGEVRHAWVDVYIESIGWVEKAVEFKGNEWKLLDPTFSAALSENQAADYIGNGDNYILQYVR